MRINPDVLTLDRGEQAIIPHSRRIQVQTGVGRAKIKNGSLFDEGDSSE